MARGLAENEVVVISGLAAGIDTAAHTATLEAGGRTVAVMGTGISRPVYPAANRALARRIVASGGGLVSQFWPTAPASARTFPQRNITMSGMSIGSVVIEAPPTSGARMQARVAAEQGKQVWLLRSLADAQPWAARMLATGKATSVSELGDVLNQLQQDPAERRQLALGTHAAPPAHTDGEASRPTYGSLRGRSAMATPSPDGRRRSVVLRNRSGQGHENTGEGWQR